MTEDTVGKTNNIQTSRTMIFTMTRNESDVNKSGRGCIWKQLLMSFLISLPFFTQGVKTSILTISTHSGHYISTPDDVPVSTTVLLIAAALASPVHCYASNRFGRKFGIYLISLIQGVSIVPLLLVDSDAVMIVLHLLAGIASSGLFIILPSYIQELSPEPWRGLTLTFTYTMTSFGHLMRFFMDTDIMMYLILSMVVIQFILMLSLYESPSFLVMKSNSDKAVITISGLINLPPEHPVVLRKVRDLEVESFRAKLKGSTSLCGIFKNHISRNLLKIGISLQTVLTLSGSIIFLDHTKALEQLKLHNGLEDQMVVLSLVAAGIIVTASIVLIDRKYILTIAFAVLALSLGILGVYTQHDLTVTSLRWLPVASLAVSVVAYGVAVGTCAAVVVEILNFEIRATVLAIVCIYHHILKLAHIYSFKYVDQYMGIYSVLYVFAGVNLCGAVYSLFVLPSIKGLNVRNIERQLKKIPLIR